MNMRLARDPAAKTLSRLSAHKDMKGEAMAIGPVQLVVLGFEHPKFGGSIVEELHRLKDDGVVRVIDALVVQKDSKGEVSTRQFSDLTLDEAEEFGAFVGALIGLGAAGEEGAEAGAEEGAAALAETGGHALEVGEAWEVLDDIPEDTAAAIVLLEHRWAIPLRDRIIDEGGIPIGDSWVHPTDLIAIGLQAAEEAEPSAR